MDKVDVIGVTALFVVAVGTILVIVLLVVFYPPDPDTSYQFGQEAYRLKVSPEANPYRYNKERVRWLRGWMDARQKEQAS